MPLAVALTLLLPESHVSDACAIFSDNVTHLKKRSKMNII